MGNRHQRVNQRLLMADLKLFREDQIQIDPLIRLFIRLGKVVKVGRIVLVDGQRMKDINSRAYWRWIRQWRGEPLIREYMSRLKFVFTLNLNGDDKVSTINTWAVAILRWEVGIIRWSSEEVISLHRATRKMKTMIGALRPKICDSYMFRERTWTWAVKLQTQNI